jgi:uncharacterized coiled-coil protein SlyX
MDDNYDGGATSRAITSLEDRLDELEIELRSKNNKIDELEREIGFLQFTVIAQLERDIDSLRSDVVNHSH